MPPVVVAVIDVSSYLTNVTDITTALSGGLTGTVIPAVAAIFAGLFALRAGVGLVRRYVK